jgi:hypothetical protein
VSGVCEWIGFIRTLPLDGRFAVFGLHLGAATQIGVHQGAMGDGVDVPHDTGGGLMGEFQGVLGEHRSRAPAVTEPPIDVAQRFFFGQTIQMNGEGDGLDRGSRRRHTDGCRTRSG